MFQNLREVPVQSFILSVRKHVRTARIPHAQDAEGAIIPENRKPYQQFMRSK